MGSRRDAADKATHIDEPVDAGGPGSDTPEEVAPALRGNKTSAEGRSPEDEKPTEARSFFRQYSREGGNQFYPIGPTKQVLPPGLYICRHNQSRGTFAELLNYSTDELIDFPDSISQKITEEIKVFWTKREIYKERGEQHKRGYLLWGPPGGGKTSLITSLIQGFIDDGGVVFMFTGMTKPYLEPFRDIEPDRKIMIAIEDIDTWFEYGEEQEVLSLLDGEIPLVNTVVVATTNYPEKLPDRIKNRPSRFDRVSYISNPTEAHRTIYLEKKALSLSRRQVAKWAKDTKGYSFAHLKELILAVEVFGATYNETLERLNEMRKAEASSETYEAEMRGEAPNKTVGFNSN